MTNDQRTKVELLSNCTFLPGSYDKRFVADMCAMSRQADAVLSEKQAAFLDRCYWRYRRQIGEYAERYGKAVPTFVKPQNADAP